ncbi:hypothetical protein [Desulfoferrobacter suflitae]|uniref:hypothetical protein n=1 Tax=Desulfoferrobacter suflitae TaxID=2865782 RepID=UPI00216441CE|nr:hypothetical protein [Desulfoferrobacter suflitae]MCK8603371.1 hypothetical protein [Desulfoferrobacter suflitae]
MSAKPDPKKNMKIEISLDPEEQHELQMILDRLRVQDPQGESLQSYLQSLGSALSGRENLTAALLAALSRDPSPVGFQAFLTLRDGIQNKQYKRVVKQAAYRFRQRGYAEDSDADEAASRVVLIPKETRQVVAHLIPAPDVDRLICAFFPGEGGDEPVAVTAYADDHFALLSVRAVGSSQKLYKEFIQKLTRQLPERLPFEVPIWHAARIFFEMIRFNREKSASPDIDKAKQFFQPYHDPNKPPYVYQFFNDIEHAQERLQEIDVEALLDGVFLPSLLLPKEDLSPYFYKLRQLEQSVLVVPPEIQQERLTEQLNRAVDELVIEENRYYYQRLFEEHALILKESKQMELARQAWLVARHLASSARVSENPVMNQVVVLSMQFYWSEEFARQEEREGSYQETESGLIVPR